MFLQQIAFRETDLILAVQICLDFGCNWIPFVVIAQVQNCETMLMGLVKLVLCSWVYAEYVAVFVVRDTVFFQVGMFKISIPANTFHFCVSWVRLKILEDTVNQTKVLKKKNYQGELWYF